MWTFLAQSFALMRTPGGEQGVGRKKGGTKASVDVPAAWTGNIVRRRHCTYLLLRGADASTNTLSPIGRAREAPGVAGEGGGAQVPADVSPPALFAVCAPQSSLICIFHSYERRLKDVGVVQDAAPPAAAAVSTSASYFVQSSSLSVDPSQQSALGASLVFSSTTGIPAWDMKT
jgi:hypothetical protein